MPATGARMPATGRRRVFEAPDEIESIVAKTT
jgi:hypothetical protein